MWSSAGPTWWTTGGCVGPAAALDRKASLAVLTSTSTAELPERAASERRSSPRRSCVSMTPWTRSRPPGVRVTLICSPRSAPTWLSRRSTSTSNSFVAVTVARAGCCRGSAAGPASAAAGGATDVRVTPTLISSPSGSKAEGGTPAARRPGLPQDERLGGRARGRAADGERRRDDAVRPAVAFAPVGYDVPLTLLFDPRARAVTHQGLKVPRRGVDEPGVLEDTPLRRVALARQAVDGARAVGAPPLAGEEPAPLVEEASHGRPAALAPPGLYAAAGDERPAAGVALLQLHRAVDDRRVIRGGLLFGRERAVEQPGGRDGGHGQADEEQGRNERERRERAHESGPQQPEAPGEGCQQPPERFPPQRAGLGGSSPFVTYGGGGAGAGDGQPFSPPLVHGTRVGGCEGGVVVDELHGGPRAAELQREVECARVAQQERRRLHAGPRRELDVKEQEARLLLAEDLDELDRLGQVKDEPHVVELRADPPRPLRVAVDRDAQLARLVLEDLAGLAPPAPQRAAGRRPAAARRPAVVVVAALLLHV